MPIKGVSFRKCFDYVNPKAFEVQLTVIMTITTCLLLSYCGVYEDFGLFREVIQDILSCIIGAYIGALGLLLSGIAFISSLFTHDFIKAIDRGFRILYEKKQIKKLLSGREVVTKIMNSFYFISIHVGIMICVYILVYLVLSSNRKLIGIELFWIVTVLLLYSFYFTIFYLVALIYNCIRLNNIKNKYENTYCKGFYDQVNEVRIDMLITTILNSLEGDKEKLLIDTLKQYVFDEYADEKTRTELMEYFYNRYTKRD